MNVSRVIKVRRSKESPLHINNLPAEVLITIFKYLPQNELGRISRVCRRWKEFARSPVLWKNVNVKLSWYGGSQNEIALAFSKNLSSSVVHMKLLFSFCSWRRGLNFAEFSMQLEEKCPRLHTLILRNAYLPVSLCAVIHLCSEFLPNLNTLKLPMCVFHNDLKDKEYAGISKIEILDLSRCVNVGRSIMQAFSKMPCLKKLNLSALQVAEWFVEEEDVSFLHQLEFLNVGCTNISLENFQILKDRAVNLTDLFLCYTELNDDYFNFRRSVFPLLKTVCLIDCKNLTCENIVSLVQACRSLQHVYVDRHLAESYAEHAFVTAHISKLTVVKSINFCRH